MQDYTTNSLKNVNVGTEHSERPKVEPIQGLNAKVKKPSFFEDLGELAKEAVKNTIKDIAIPALQKTFANMGYTILDILIYREPRGDYRGNGYYNYNYSQPVRSTPSYGSNGYWMSQGRQNNERRDYSYHSSRYDYRNNILWFPEEKSAYFVKNKIEETIQYGDGNGKGHFIHVAEVLQMINDPRSPSIEVTPADWNYVWTDIRDAQVYRSDGGYVLKLPKPMPKDM